MMRPEADKPRGRGMNLVKVVIVATVLGVLVAVMMPQLSSGASAEASDLLRNDLRALRTQIMIYRVQHQGRSPGAGAAGEAPDDAAFVDQLTRDSNLEGKTSETTDAGFRFGPYLLRVPVNPANGSVRVRFVLKGEPFPTGPNGPEGWVYQPETGMIAANSPGRDGNGVAYFDY